MDIIQLLTFMRLALQSDYAKPSFFINIIDEFLTDYFIDYPILVELSLAKNSDEAIDIIGKSDFFETADYQKKLIGFIILAYEKGNINFQQYKNALLDIFDTQPLEFTVEDIGMYFLNDTQLFDKVDIFLVSCKNLAHAEIASFELCLSSCRLGGSMIPNFFKG